MSEFIPGLLLAQRFFSHVVLPLIQTNFPLLKFDAALLGPGSEVLGYDDEVSTDHHWGPRAILFLTEEDLLKDGPAIKDLLGQKLPYTFSGYSTNWSEPDPNDSMNQFLVQESTRPINHRVELFTVRSYLREFLGVSKMKISQYEWLTLSEQRLLEFTSGKVFHNTLGKLEPVRARMAYFPENVWRFKLLADWEHIGQEIAFVGRSAMCGDELGSMLEAGRLVRYIMRIGYILSKKYTPYPKWFGTGFSRLSIARDLYSVLLSITKEDSWRQRENLLCRAYLILIKKMMELKIVPKLSIKPVSYHNRDQIVINAEKVCNEIKTTIKEPLASLEYPLGSVDHFIDQTDILTNAKLSRKSITFYDKE
ncbi:MAG: DUF4037 domain-containing protein [Candidatus Heimdallarchaeota archaeon]